MPDGDTRHLWEPHFSADGRYLTIESGISGPWAIDIGRVLDGASMEDAVVANLSGDGGATRYPTVAGDWLVASQGDGQVLRFWDLSTEAEWMTVPVDHTSVQVSPDGGQLYYADDWAIRRLPLAHTELAELARERVRRDFLAEECLRFDLHECPADK